MSTGAPPTRLRPPARLRGELRVPGDKSISHRALLLNSIATGAARITGAGLGADCRSTLRNLRQLGVKIDEPGDGKLVVHGRGLAGLREAEDTLDCGNSGTTMRLLLGVLAGLPFSSTVTGDKSLRGRPMGRITDPLRQMGARISGRNDGRKAPLAVEGGELHGIEYKMPVASAQLKSSLLLAGLAAKGRTVLHQTAVSRDHTELMLAAQGVAVQSDGLTLTIEGGQPASAVDIDVPGDVSSAAFWMIAAAIHPDADLTLRNVGINPTRAGVLAVLRRMRADIQIEEIGGGPEPVADIRIRSSQLCATRIGGTEIPTLIDELPALALAATQAEGATEVRDAAELRVKESDRIAVTATGLRHLGADIQELDDGFIINGPTPLVGAAVDGHDDHRLAMSLGVGSLIATGETVLHGADCVDVSYPGFWEQLARIGSQHD
ncbi:MAG: 3-phosphoshikimate 1-carboxyvinyltransferase [Chloroflexota bacterium]|nr:3-phosphoshikimate 1-carboxyvinyltransferase [Chloroflexota bacterium]